MKPWSIKSIINLRTLFIILIVSYFLSLFLFFFSRNPFIFCYCISSFAFPNEAMNNIREIQDSHLGFDHIYVLNLKQRVDRRDHMKKMAFFQHLQIEFFFAPESNTINTSSFPTHMTLGEISCYQGHLNIYKSVVDRNFSTALIFEDDIDLELNIRKRLGNIFRILPHDWEILYLGHCTWEGWGKNQVERMNPLFRSNSPDCTHGYAVTNAGARKLISLLNTPTKPVDLQINSFIRNGRINSYSVDPPIITQLERIFDTSIIRDQSRQKLKNQQLSHSSFSKVEELERNWDFSPYQKTF